MVQIKFCSQNLGIMSVGFEMFGTTLVEYRGKIAQAKTNAEAIVFYADASALFKALIQKKSLDGAIKAKVGDIPTAEEISNARAALLEEEKVPASPDPSEAAGEAEKRVAAATTIQRVYRGYRGREISKDEEARRRAVTPNYEKLVEEFSQFVEEKLEVFGKNLTKAIKCNVWPLGTQTKLINQLRADAQKFLDAIPEDTASEKVTTESFGKSWL